MFDISQGSFLDRHTGWIGTIVVLIMVSGVVFLLDSLPDKPSEKFILGPTFNTQTHGGHTWVTFGKGGLYHHPDCPSEHPERK